MPDTEFDPTTVGDWFDVEGAALRSPSGREVMVPLDGPGSYAAVAPRLQLDNALIELATNPDRPWTENAIQSSMSDPIADLPVWYAPANPDNPDDQPGNDQVSQFEKLLDLLSKILDALNRVR